MNEDQITTLDMFKLLREDIKSLETRLVVDIQDLRSDIQSLEERMRNVEEAVAGKKAVSIFQKTLMDWLFRIAAAVGVGRAIKAFFS